MSKLRSICATALLMLVLSATAFGDGQMGTGAPVSNGGQMGTGGQGAVQEATLLDDSSEQSGDDAFALLLDAGLSIWGNVIGQL